MKRKKNFFLCLFSVLLVFLFSGTALAGGPDYVYAKKLSIKDITPFIEMELSKHPRSYIKLDADVALVKVYGVHQKEGRATVYFRFQYTSRNKQGMRDANVEFIRFNSGKWFHEKSGQYVTK